MRIFKFSKSTIGLRFVSQGTLASDEGNPVKVIPPHQERYIGMTSLNCSFDSFSN
jgi:hypothetical protein